MVLMHILRSYELYPENVKGSVHIMHYEDYDNYLKQYMFNH